MAGLTVFANSKPFDEIIGHKLTDLVEGRGVENQKFKVVEAT